MLRRIKEYGCIILILILNKAAPMKKLFALLLVGILILIACSAPASNTKLRVLTTGNAPYNYVDDKGQVAGSSTEVVRAILKKLGQEITIEPMLWDKAFELAQKEPNVALYSTARVSWRENLFQWVGPIGKGETVLYAKKGSGIKLNSAAELKGRTVAGVKEDSGGQYCLQQGAKLVNAPEDEDGFKLVANGGAELTTGNADISYAAKKAGFNPDDFERVLTLESYDMYIVFSKSTPASTIKQWQQALDSIKK